MAPHSVVTPGAGRGPFKPQRVLSLGETRSAAMGFKHDGDIIRYDGFGFVFERAASTTKVSAVFHVPMWSIEDELLGMMRFREGAERPVYDWDH